MKQGLILVCVLLAVFPLLTGCWDRLEIEERGTILGLAIDPIEGETVSNVTGPYAKSNIKGYLLTVQIAIPGRIPLGPSQGGGQRNGEKPVWILSVTGKTIDDALNNLQQELADKVFFGHLRVIIVNQQIARSAGFSDVQDFLRRNSEIRRLAWLLISKDKAKEAMVASPKLERVPTLYLVSTMDHAVQMGKLPNVFLGNFWSIISSQGRDAVLPLIDVFQGDRIAVKGLAVFKNEKMMGSLDPLEVATYMEMRGEPRGGYGLAVPVPGDPVHSVIIRGTTRKIKVILRKGKGVTPYFDVYVRIEANIEEMTGRYTVGDSRIIEQIGKEGEQIITDKQKATIIKLKRLKADPVGFGEYIRGQDPKYWATIRTRDRWEQEFPNIPIRFHNTVSIRRTGMSAR